MSRENSKHKRTKFYIAKDGMQLIAYSADRIKRMIVTGKLSGDDLLFSKYLEKWTRVRNVKGLRSLVTKTEAGVILDEMEQEDLQESFSDINTLEKTKSDDQDEKLKKTESYCAMSPDTTVKRRPIIDITRQKSDDSMPETIKRSDLSAIIKALAITACLGIIVLGSIVFFRTKETPSRITGTVTYQGQLIEDGIISFESEGEMAPATSGVIENGKYDIKADSAIDSGQMTVRIFGYRRPAGVPPRQTGEKAAGDPEATEMYIPDEHNNASKQKVIIYSDRINKYDFDLVQPVIKKK